MLAARRETVLLIVMFFLYAAAGRGGERVSQVLMIGNSLTAGNQLDQLVQQIAQSAGETVQVKSSTLGGATIEEHARSANTLANIERQAWDVVVLQDHGLLPANTRLTSTSLIPAARRLMARVAAKKGRVILLMPWARRDGVTATVFMGESMAFKDYTAEQEAQRAGCEQAAQALGVPVAPAGLAWKAFREKYPDVNLYNDIMHGNINGSYLAALTVYAAIYGRSPRAITWHPAQIPDELAKKIVAVTADVCEQYAAEKKKASEKNGRNAETPRTPAAAPAR